MAGQNEYTIKIVVNADGTAAVKGFEQVNESMKKITASSGGLMGTLGMLGNKWLALGVGLNQTIDLFNKMTEIPRKIIAIGEAGAALVRAEAAFNAVTAAAGEFGPAVAKSLEEAAGGYMDASDIMEKSGRLISGGVPTKSLEELMALLKRMAPMVGDTLPTAWDKAMESFSRGSLRQMKVYTGYVDMNKALSEWAEKHGVLSAGLTEEARLMAMVEIAMEKGRKKLEGMTGAVNEHVDTITKARKEMKEAWETIEKGATPVAAKLLGWAASVVKWMAEEDQRLRENFEQSVKRSQAGLKPGAKLYPMPEEPIKAVKETPPLLRPMTQEEERALVDKTMAAQDSWDSRMRILDRELEAYKKTYNLDAREKTLVEQYKAAIVKQFQKEQTLITLAEQEKRQAAYGDEEGAIRTRFEMEVRGAKGNQTIIASIREREKVAVQKYQDDIAAFYIKAYGDQLKEEENFQLQIMTVRQQAGLVGEEEALEARIAGKQRELSIEKDIAQQILSLTREPEKRRQLVQQIQALENRSIEERKLGEIELAVYRIRQAREIARIQRELDAELLTMRLGLLNDEMKSRVRMGTMTEGAEIEKRYENERRVLEARMENLQVLINEKQNQEEVAQLVSDYVKLQEQWNQSGAREALEIQDMYYEKGKQILDLTKEQHQIQQEGITQSMDRINALLDLTASSQDQLLQTLALGMKSVTSGSTGVLASLGETDPLGERYKRQLEIYKKMEEATRDHEDRERIMAEQSKALQTAFEEKEWGKRVAMASGAFGALAGLSLSFYAITGKQSKAALGMYQGFAVAQAIMDTYASAVLAYKRGLEVPYIGAYLAPTLAAIAVAAGMARVAAIKAQTFHTGGEVMGSAEEVATVLQRKEVVIDRETAQREGGYAGIMNRLNERETAAASPQDIQVINVLDESIIQRWALGATGRRTIKNIVGVTQ